MNSEGCVRIHLVCRKASAPSLAAVVRTGSHSHQCLAGHVVDCADIRTTDHS
jgi:hypothetical protein